MKRNVILFCTLLAAGMILVPACKNGSSTQPPATKTDTVKTVQVQVPDLQADSAYAM